MLETLCNRCQTMLYWYESSSEWTKIFAKHHFSQDEGSLRMAESAAESHSNAVNAFFEWRNKPCTCGGDNEMRIKVE